MKHEPTVRCDACGDEANAAAGTPCRRDLSADDDFFGDGRTFDGEPLRSRYCSGTYQPFGADHWPPPGHTVTEWKAPPGVDFRLIAGAIHDVIHSSAHGASSLVARPLAREIRRLVIAAHNRNRNP